MGATDRTADSARRSESESDEDGPTISAYSTNETKTVFTESDNGDGWIATDLTVDVRR